MKKLCHYISEYMAVLVLVGCGMQCQQEKGAMDEGRILFVSLQSENVRMYSQPNADKAIRYIIDHAEEIVFGCVAPNSNNERLLQSLHETKKRISILVK